jgi:hypothetical protein
MRTAPPVRVAVAHRGAWRLAIAWLVALCIGACTAWVLAHAHVPHAHWAAVGAFALGGVASWRLQPSHEVLLAWDGSQWSLDTRQGRLRVMVDVGGWMLLCLDPATAGARAWVAVGAARAGASWHVLRAAVYSRGPNKSDE